MRSCIRELLDGTARTSSVRIGWTYPSFLGGCFGLLSFGWIIARFHPSLSPRRPRREALSIRPYSFPEKPGKRSSKIWGEIWDVKTSKPVIIETVPVAIAGLWEGNRSLSRIGGTSQKLLIFGG